MKLSAFAVKRPVTITILVGVLLILGFVALSELPLDLYPEMKFPIGAVITSYSGAGPEEVESQISKPIEDVMGTLSDVNEISSYSMAGNSYVIVQFDWGTDMDFASLNMREKLALVERYLPDSAGDPMVMKMDPSMMPILQIGLNGGKNLAQLQDIAENDIKPRLERISGVASVTLTGGYTREVKVDVDPVKLQNYGIAMNQISLALSPASDNFNQAGGSVKSSGRDYYVRVLQQFETIDDIRNIVLTSSSGQQVRLRDLAEISDGYADISQKTRMNMEPSIGIHIQKQSGANTVSVSNKVKVELESLSKELPGGMQVGIVYDQAEFINQSIDNIKKMMLEGAALAMLILFLFLRSVPSTLVIATSIPLSIIATFILMYFTGMTMNLISMGGIALGIGRMVDDSIVVLESIFRHRKSGESPWKAAINGASEVGTAVMASTFTTVAVFAPIVFTEGLAGVIFKPLAMTVSFAILSSLLVALTIIPLLSSRTLTAEIVHEVDPNATGLKGAANRFAIFIDGLGEWYRGVINWALGHRKMVIAVVTLLMIGSIPVAYFFIGAEFMSKTDASQIAVSVELDKGSSLEETDKATRVVEETIDKIPEVDKIFTSVGSSGSYMMMGGSTNQSNIKVMLAEKSKRVRGTGEIAEEIREKISGIAGAKMTVTETDPTSQGMSSGSLVTVSIKGEDLDVLKSLSNQISEIVRDVKGTREVQSSLAEGSPEVRIVVDRDKAASYGLTPYSVATIIKNAVQGSVAATYRVEGDEVDIRVRYNMAAREDVDSLKNLTVTSTTGVQVPLSQLATIKQVRGPVTINRSDSDRVATITADVQGRDSKSVNEEIQQKIERLRLPTGYFVEYGGQYEQMMESFTSLAYALLLAIILVYAVMAIQYESFFIPFVIMFSVPTCIIGIVAGLAITGRAFSVPAFIGAIMLVGIAVSNAIVLVDYIKTLRKRGLGRNEAIAEAGAVRLRPVLMTALATILAMLPMALGIGEGAEAEAPLATVVIGGLLASTAITLVLIPVVYTLFDDWGNKLSNRFGRKQQVEVDSGVEA